MKAAPFTGTFVLLLLAAPAQTCALGLVEYGPEAAAEQPVLSLPRLNSTLECLRGWQTGPAAGSFRKTVMLLFGFSRLLLAGALLAGYGPGRRESLAKARRTGHPHQSGWHGRGLPSPQ